MHPVFMDLGFAKIHSYGLFIVIGFLVGIFFVRRKALSEKLDPGVVTDIVFWSFIVGMLGGHLTHIITTIQDYIAKPQMLLRFWEGGLVFYGGLIIGLIFLCFLAIKAKISILKIFDIVAPSIAIGHMFGRIGCFFAGCCHGSMCDPNFVFAVTFTDPLSAAPLGIPLYPAQIYEALNCLFVFIILQIWWKKRTFDGQIIAMYLMLYAVGRFIIEIYRGDEIRKFVIPNLISTSQFIGIVTFCAALAFYIYKSRKIKAHPLK